MTSINKEDYLRAIYHLMERNPTVKSVEVADYLGITKPSVSEMLRSLDTDGLIQYKPYAKIKLTTRGFKQARNLTARHRIIETFLQNTLKLNPKHVHEEAHRLEHAFSNEAIEKMKRFLNNPKKDPHGKPIPPL